MLFKICLIIAVTATVIGADKDQAPVSTKTVYGFLDFTTTVNDVVMIFKPSKTAGGQKGRSVAGGATRTASVLRSKPAKPKVKIETTQPILIEASSTVDLDLEAEEESGRSGSIGRIKSPIRPRPGGEVQIEGSLIHVDDPIAPTVSSHKTTERLKAALRPRPTLTSTTAELRGTGSVVSSFPLMHSHVVVSSRVDVRIGGVSKVASSNKALPKQVEIRTEVKLSPEGQQQDKRRMPVGQSLISKTVGTRIQDGMTTIHETSVIGTTIAGQYAHFVQSTSRIFQEPITATSVLPGIPGSVEVVTDLPSTSHTVQQSKKVTAQQKTTSSPVTEEAANLDSLPSLESLFKSVNAGKEEELPAPEQLVGRKKIPVVVEEDDQTSAVLLKPSFRITPTSATPKTTTEEKTTTEKTTTTTETTTTTPATTTTSKSTPGNLERRAGLASPPRLSSGNSGPRPQRTEEQRWRYNPTPKPKVAIQRTGSGGSRFRDRVTTNAPQRDQDADYVDSVNNNEPEPAAAEIDPTEVITLRVQTVTPEGYKNLYYEVATIKSPYIMRLGAVRNTRYVTLTRSFTRLITPTPAPVVTPTETESGYDDELPLDPESEVLLDSSQQILPDPENILATTTPYENILKDSSDTATLPAIIVAATESGDDFNLQTVTETFSTTELAMKTSILPYLRAGATSFMTLTQSYYITRVVVAVKTVPPLDLYQFIPSKTLTDISTNLQEAGSEHNERLLPGELEFSENDEFADEDEEHRHEKRVPAPHDFQSDLSSIGQDFDLSSVDRPHQVELEPSLVDTAAESTATRHLGTPPLPNGGFQLESSINNNNPQQFQLQQETPVLTPEQLQQLALFRFMNPYAAAAGLNPFGYPGLPGFGGAGGGVQVITTSQPVVRTVDVIRTETVPIWDGVKTIYSTVRRTKGTTVVTETEYGTTTIPAQVNPLFPQQQFTVMSSPIVTEITTTSTELRIYRIIFRAQTTYTTVTSTSVFPTLVTTYISSTVPIQPTAFPQGLFPGSYGFPTFG